jgi:Tol biopolymer transport system component
VLQGARKKLLQVAFSAWFAIPVLLMTFQPVGGRHDFSDQVNLGSNGELANGTMLWTTLSANARYVAFSTDASNLVPGDTNSRWDIFVRDRQLGQTQRVSISSNGVQANHNSDLSSISGDGRYIAFSSSASNLVPGDGNGFSDVFVHDRLLGSTIRVVDSHLVEPNGPSSGPKVSVDGRFVAFSSRASNLVPGDSNSWSDSFVWDRFTGVIERVSVNSSEVPANSPSGVNAISGDGRFVVLSSNAKNLVRDDTNLSVDVFLRDRSKGTTVRVSVDSDGNEGQTHSFATSISADGRYVAFYSMSVLTAGDSNGTGDIFVHDMRRRVTERVSVGLGGQDTNGNSQWPLISGNGRFVGFWSHSSNLVPRDTNGSVVDAFVYDRRTRRTILVSVSHSNAGTNGHSAVSAMSYSGRDVLWWSDATNVLKADTNGSITDLFVSRLAGHTLH